jgi:isoleucyl-tRNA synthetase
MAVAREVVTLGRAARNDAGIRVRQPLPAISIASESADISLSDEMKAEVADELNVKAVLIADNVEAFARRVVRPIPKLLGPRLGGAFPAVNRALQGGQYTLNSDGTVTVDGHSLSPDEVTVSLQPLENQAVAQDLQWQGGMAVALDRTITPELRDEGLARELIHRVQTMRKDAGLNVEDRISLGYGATDHLRRVFAAHGDRIREEVGAVDLRETEAPIPSPATDADGIFSWHGVLEEEEIMLALHRVP